MIARAQGERTGCSYWEGGRHPSSIDGGFAHSVAMLECDWNNESKVGRQDGFTLGQG